MIWIHALFLEDEAKVNLDIELPRKCGCGLALVALVRITLDPGASASANRTTGAFKALLKSNDTLSNLLLCRIASQSLSNCGAYWPTSSHIDNLHSSTIQR
jgi:hypothetical protein